MTNNQQADADWTAPLRELVALLRKMEAAFKQEREFILQHYPDEQVGDFPSLNGIETMPYADLEIRKIMCGVALKVVGRRAGEVQAEVDEAERIRDEQNLTEQQAWRKSVERALAYQGAKIAKLEAALRPAAASHAASPTRPQMGGLPVRDGGVRKIGAGVSASAPEAPWAGVTRRQHPLDVIGSSGRRG